MAINQIIIMFHINYMHSEYKQIRNSLQIVVVRVIEYYKLPPLLSLYYLTVLAWERDGMLRGTCRAEIVTGVCGREAQLHSYYKITDKDLKGWLFAL